MTQPYQPHEIRPSYDVLGSPEPVPGSGGRGRGRALLVGLVGAGVLAVAGGAVAVAGFLGGGGAQPEDALPAGAIGMVKVDLDPAAGQKLAIYRLAMRFPSTADSVQGEDDVKDDLLSALFEDAPDLDYDRDLAPWIGDRAGIALVPGGAEPQPLAAIAFTDRTAADKALERLTEGEEDSFYAFSENADFVLLGTTQAAVDSAAAASEVLADDAGWKKGVDALEGDQVVTGWADLGRLVDALPQDSREAAAEAYGVGGELDLSGTVVMGAHAADDHVEVVARMIDVQSSTKASTLVGAGPSSGLLAGLPEDTLAAMSVTDLGPGLAEVFETAYSADDPLGLVAYAEELGIVLPDDLSALLGQDTVVAAFPGQSFAARSRTEDVDTAFATASTLAEAFLGAASEDVLRRLDDGVAVGTDASALQAVATSNGGLGDRAAFRKALPDAEEAGTLIYVDVAGTLPLLGDPAELGEDVQQLEAFGATGTGDARNATSRMRLTVRD